MLAGGCRASGSERVGSYQPKSCWNPLGLWVDASPQALKSELAMIAEVLKALRGETLAQWPRARRQGLSD